MSGYIYGLICASAAIGIAELVIPENAKTRPYLKLILGLALLLAVIRPLGELGRMLPELGESLISNEAPAEDYSGISGEALADAYRSGISADLRQSFGLESFEVGVMLDGEYRPRRVTVTLMGKDIFRDPYKIESRIEGAFGCECVVVLG